MTQRLRLLFLPSRRINKQDLIHLKERVARESLLCFTISSKRYREGRKIPKPQNLLIQRQKETINILQSYRDKEFELEMVFNLKYTEAFKKQLVMQAYMHTCIYGCMHAYIHTAKKLRNEKVHPFPF